MRQEKLSTSVSEDEKAAFRVVAAEENMTMAEKLRELVYDELEDHDYDTSR